MDIESVAIAANRLSEVFAELGAEIREVIEAFEEVIRIAFNLPRKENEKNEQPLQKRAQVQCLTIRRCSRKMPIRYNYIPRPLRNQPYQRRAY